MVLKSGRRGLFFSPWVTHTLGLEWQCTGFKTPNKTRLLFSRGGLPRCTMKVQHPSEYSSAKKSLNYDVTNAQPLDAHDHEWTPDSYLQNVTFYIHAYIPRFIHSWVHYYCYYICSVFVWGSSELRGQISERREIIRWIQNLPFYGRCVSPRLRVWLKHFRFLYLSAKRLSRPDLVDKKMVPHSFRNGY